MQSKFPGGMLLFCAQLTWTLLANSCNVQFVMSTSVYLCGRVIMISIETWIDSSWTGSVQVLNLISFLKLNFEGFLSI